ncbi:MAG TPA: glycosyltransferase family 1 protein [Thermomicrobiaceae bacterium]|nr:glycosyltransferase family 1 protein [Thermomicrobiaceae bacterium]
MRRRDRPRILLDGRLLGNRDGGISRYTDELARALPAVAPDLDVRLLVRRGRAAFSGDSTVAPARTLTPPHHRLERWAFGLEASLRKPALLHSPDFIPPIVPLAATVVTIHDLAFLDPEGEAAVTPRSLRYYGQVIHLAARADAVIAVSEYVRQSIIERLRVPESRVRTIYNGVTGFAPPALESHGQPTARGEGQDELPREVRLAIERDRPIVLMVGTIEPRKRHGLLLDAFELSLPRRSGPRPYLVVVGAEGWNCRSTAARLKVLSASGDGSWFPGAADHLLGQLLRRATLLAMPSRDEGFGLPMLEAMAAGVPVIAAARGALPEIAGGAAVLVGSDDAEEWSQAIEALIGDESRRAELMRAGLLRASAFSWDRTAHETAQLYREVLGR